MKSKKKFKLIVALIILIILSLWFVWGNTALTVTEIIISNEKIPESFSGFRIVQISDLHNAQFGENNKRLINKIEKIEPDIIVITGDLIDANKTDVEIAAAFAEQSVKIAPTYYVTGNHEANNMSEYEKLKFRLEDAGVVILENKSVIIEKGNECIKLAGVNDYFFSGDFESFIGELTEDKEMYTVLLSHRPEFFELYTEKRVDLVFSGHAHGGQFRIPFVGGVVAPGQGFFPEYDAGKYTQDETTMIVSRGLGNSIIPLRINNPPEIVVAELKSQ